MHDIYKYITIYMCVHIYKYVSVFYIHRLILSYKIFNFTFTKVEMKVDH